MTDPAGAPYQADDVKADNRRGHHFRRVRAIAMKAGAPYRILDHLRHSAVTHAKECGADMDDLPGLTAHADPEMARRVYLQRSEAMSERVQRARKIIE